MLEEALLFEGGGYTACFEPCRESLNRVASQLISLLFAKSAKASPSGIPLRIRIAQELLVRFPVEEAQFGLILNSNLC